MNHSKGFMAAVQRALETVKEIDCDTLKSRIDGNDKFVLIDVREQDEWEKGRLPKAHYIGKGVIERDIEKAVPDQTAECILYCGGGSRSALAAKALQDMGYTNVISLKGGFRGWVEKDFPVER